MERKCIHVSLLCCVTSSLIASPPPPPTGSPFGVEMAPPAASVSSEGFAPLHTSSVGMPEEHFSSPFAPPAAFNKPVESSFGAPSIESGPGLSSPFSPPSEFGAPSFELPHSPAGAPAFNPSGEHGMSFGSPHGMQPAHHETFNPHEHEIISKQIEEEAKAVEEQDSLVQQGIDSFEAEGSGNWLLKRVWWEKTESVYESIKHIFNQVLDSRTHFITARNKLDRELDIFYGEMGLEQGPLHDIITHILSLMEKMRASQGDVLSPKEEDLVKKTKEKEQVLLQLKADIKGIQTVEEKLDQALNTLFKQIDVCSEYEQRAWTMLKDIARELNDKEARKSFYQTEALLEDIKKIQTYLNGPFSHYFDQTTQLAREYAHKITTNMQNLRNQGIDLQKEALRLENERDEPQPKPKVAKEVAKKKESAGFFGSITQFFKNIWNSIFGWFGASETKVKVRAKAADQDGLREVKKDAGILGKELEDFSQDNQPVVHESQKAVPSHQMHHQQAMKK